ncbi:MAG: DUF3352 domain-containing protein [Cyanobacteria bacterium P01_H01_bin.119]
MKQVLRSVLPAVLAVPALLAAAFPAGATEPEPRSPLPAAALLPQNTAVTILINTQAFRWETLTQFRLFQLVQEVSGESLTFETIPFLTATAPPSTTGAEPFDYQQEIAPWLGDTVTLAILPLPAGDLANRRTFDQQSIMLAPIASRDRFEGFIDRLAGTRAEPPQRETYQEIPVLYWEAIEETISNEEEDFEFDESDGVTGYPARTQSRNSGEPEAPETGLTEAETKAILDDDDSADIEFEPELPQTYVVEPGLAIAVINQHLVLGTDIKAMRQLIDAQINGEKAGLPVLAETRAFGRTYNSLAYEDALVRIYGNISEVNRYSFQEILSDDFPFPFPFPLPDIDLSEADLEGLTEVESYFESFIKTQPEGIRIQSRVFLDDPLFALVRVPDPVEGSELFSLMPAPTYFMVNNQDLAGLWQIIATTLGSFEQTRGALEIARSAVSAATGLDLDDDIFGWMDGNYAFFLFPTREGLIPEFLPSLELGIGAMIQTSDRDRADNTLDALGEFVSRFDILVEDQLVHGVPATAWNVVDSFGQQNITNELFGHSWVSEDILLLTSGGGTFNQFLNPAISQSLLDHYTFQQATESLPTSNQGYLYINFGSTLSMVYQALGSFIPESEETNQVKQFLGGVHSFSLTTTHTGSYIQVDFLTGLAPAIAVNDSEN